jgi:hypothetical protein
VVEVTVGNVLMRYPTFYVVICDGDSAVLSTAFSQLVTSKGLHRFNGFGRSTDAPRPAQRPSLGSAAGRAAKPVNPNSFFTSQRLHASYQDLDTIFDNYYYTLLSDNFVSSLLDISRSPF